ncbi:hypothetical protein AAX29_00915 [Aliarcobacter thereius]|uniref:Uncharacterized protein n=1 Tax=Aliarcobacter thereius TaxID=544718 RepID=A0A1C0B8D4_9BACT|nr:hypothetical protein [Aliarcobacter thereius]OCL99865.1 hypothetical protein AAX29_00915 [Aliarcobacter thereius]TLS73226.1 hypothetical protein FE246_01700 [Aliarcobacter thereius]
MFKKDTLFINLIKQQNQLKVEQKKFKRDNIDKISSSTYLINEDVIPTNIATKINQIQEDGNAYSSTLLLSDTTKIVPKKSARVKDCTICDFDLRHDIVVLDTTLFETKNFFAPCGIDFIYSAFHIMKQHIIRHNSRSELLLFIYNSKAYILIVDKHSNIIFNEVVPLLSFDTVKKTHFYEDDLEGQKLFDELYFMELNNLIQNVLLNFHKQREDIFVQKISLLLPLKNLSKEQINTLSQELKLKIDDYAIDIDSELDILTKENLGASSFVKPRIKKVKNDPRYIILIFLFAILFYGTYFILKDINFIQLAEKLDLIKSEKTVKIDLPNHIENNENIIFKIKKVFDTIPSKVTINSFRIDNNSLDLELLAKDETNLKLLTSSLNNIYKDFNLNKKDDKNEDFFVDISFKKEIKDDNIYKNINKIDYLTDEVFALEDIEEQLKTILKEGSELSFIKKDELSLINKFTFLVKMEIDNPNELFEMISKINSELYSINITYPIIIKQNESGLLSEFYIGYFQKKN